MKRIPLSRRRFLGSSLASLAGISIVPRRLLGGPGHTPPSEQLTRGVIGVGGMGRGHVSSIFTDAKLLAVCDVDANHLKRAVELGGADVAGYRDFREVIDRKDIDVIHIPTPPHWHALISVAAANAGKDVWCEKPMTRTIGEGQKVVEAVQRNGRIFRLNTWFRFRGQFYGLGAEVASVKKAVENGILGWPIKVTIGSATGFNWKFNWIGKTNLPQQPVPEHLDYEMWLGPAPYKPYHPHRVHATFRGYWDYDGGGLGDMGQHYLDPIQYLLDKDDESPIQVEADAPPQHPDACGTWREVRLKYADGCEIILDGANRYPQAAFIEGPEGKIFKGMESNIPNLKKKLESLPPPKPQVTDFAEAVRQRKKFALNEANGHRSCTIVNLAKIAVRLRRPLRFDGSALRFVNDDRANRFINQPMRFPWMI